MAIFNNDIFAPEIPVFEGSKYDPECGGIATIVSECNQDQLDVIRAMHAADIAELKVKAKYRSLRESADDTDDDEEEELKDVEEAAIGNIFQTIKDGFAKLWARIKAFFKNLYEKLFVYSKSNKSFAETYTSKLNEIDGNPSTTVQGHEYASGEMIVTTMNSIVKKSEDFLKTYTDQFSPEKFKSIHYENERDNKGSFLLMSSDEIRDKFLMRTVGITNKNLEGVPLATALIIAYRNGKDEAKRSIKYNKTELIKELESVKEIDPKKYKKAEATISSGYDKLIKSVNAAEKTYAAISAEAGSEDATKKANLLKETRNFSSGVTMMKTTSLTAISTSRTCVVEYADQIKHAVIQMLTEAKDAKKAAAKASK